MVADTNEDVDVIGIADDDLEASVQVFYVRRGRVVGRKGFVLDKVEALTPARLIDRVLDHLYSDDPPQGVPKLVLVPTEPEDLGLYQEWLSLAREARVRSGCPSAATAGRCSRRSRATPRRSSSATACAAPATTTPGARRSTSCSAISTCPRRRCASSATTWPTSRAPTTWARWW